MKLRSFVPNFKRYVVLAGSADAIARANLSIHTVAIAPVTKADLPAIEASRPGYGAQAARYLDLGHLGFAARSDAGDVLALGWIAYNPGPQTVRIEYFPLPPGMALVRAGWTSPSFRGQGIHKQMAVHRACVIASTWPGAVVVANFAPDNLISMANYRKLGFLDAGVLHTASWGPWKWTRWYR